MKLYKQILSYSVANIITSSVPLVLLPILTWHLNPEEFGLLSLVQLLMMFSLPFVLLNIHGLFVIEYSKLNKEEFVKFISSMIWIPIFGYLGLEMVFWKFQYLLATFFNVPQQMILWVPFFALMQSMPTLIPVLFQAKKDPLKYSLYKIGMSITNLCLSVFFVVALNYGWEGRLWGIILSYVVFSIIGIVILKYMSLLRLIFSVKYIKDSLRFGIPLIPHAVAGSMLMMLDRAFLSNMLGIKHVGVYSVAFQIAGVISVLVTSINQAWVPQLYEKLNKNPSDILKREIVRDSYKIILVMVFIVTCFIFVVPIVFDVFIDSKYHEGKFAAGIIAIAFLFQGFYLMVTNYIFYAKKTYILSILTLCSLIVLAALNYFFIPRYGMLGSAYALLVTWLVFFVLVWFFSNKVYRMPWFCFFKREGYN